MVLSVTNRAVQLRTWLDGSGTESRILAAEGLEAERLVTFLVAPARGTYRLWASALDACGRTDQTGIVRTVEAR